MELSRVGVILAVAIVAGLIGAFIGRSWGGAEGGGKCDLHLSLTDRELQAIRTNLARARAQGFESASAEGQNRDGANKAAEELAFDTFVHNLRDRIGEEYARHRTAMDGCF